MWLESDPGKELNQEEKVKQSNEKEVSTLRMGRRSVIFGRKRETRKNMESAANQSTKRVATHFNQLTVFLTLLVLSVEFPGQANGGWGYVDQSGWSALHGTSCGGLHQSPIDLPNVCSPGNSNVTRVNPSLNLRLINYDMQMPPSVLTLRNNGHTAVVSLRDSRRPNAWLPKISGSVVGGDKYQLLQLHFHWDSNVSMIVNNIPSLHITFYLPHYANDN